MEEKKTLIPKAYLQYVSEQGQRPSSVRSFAESIDLTESDFYQEFGSFTSLEEAVFLSYFESTLLAIGQGEEYQEFSAREKILTLLYTWLGVLQKNRSFIVFLNEQASFPCLGDAYTDSTKASFLPFVRKIIKEGIEEGEIADRFWVTRWYRDGFWLTALGVLQYWLRDTSRSFEKTDAFIEKSVNFFFDLIQPNSLDSGFDLVKFLFQKK